MVRSVIVIFGVLSISFVVWFFCTGDPDPYEELDSLAEQFDDQPSKENLRSLLNYPADGVFSYYQMALVGVSFNRSPEVFRQVSEDLETAQERYWIKQLGMSGGEVFQYHPELKPSGFDDLFNEQTWLYDVPGSE